MQCTVLHAFSSRAPGVLKGERLLVTLPRGGTVNDGRDTRCTRLKRRAPPQGVLYSRLIIPAALEKSN